MPVRDHIDVYLEGWRLGDPNRSLQACTPDFYYDDPNTERISREGFVDFVEDFKTYGASLNHGGSARTVSRIHRHRHRRRQLNRDHLVLVACQRYPVPG